MLSQRPTCHTEWRIKGTRALRAHGIDGAAGLACLRPRKLLSRNLDLRSIGNPASIGRAWTRRGASRSPWLMSHVDGVEFDYFAYVGNLVMRAEVAGAGGVPLFVPVQNVIDALGRRGVRSPRDIVKLPVEGLLKGLETACL